MAIRAENAAYSVDDVLYVRTMTPAERRARRKAAGLTQAELADRLGAASGVTVRHWESGYRIPSGPIAARYGAFLREVAAASP